MPDLGKVDILKPTGLGSTPREAVALVVKLPDNIAHRGGRPAFVNHDGPTGKQCGKIFLPCFHYCPFLMSGPIIYKSTTGCTTGVANCHRKCP